ncbi:winged helix-turn-helix transcriptional regulator [Pseudoalteromonas sp. SG41-2]|nr:winged helix-turn-helix transcriptional regulator [Pseudoalteromonas sp. SR45-6]MBB1480935.1 winged helix-turn-helix transcriptional regulator [Pseudoalteromonas sp. SG41-2]
MGGKWKGSSIYHLKGGLVRFNDLTRLLGEVSEKGLNIMKYKEILL